MNLREGHTAELLVSLMALEPSLQLELGSSGREKIRFCALELEQELPGAVIAS